MDLSSAIRKRTPLERSAYLQGFLAGIRYMNAHPGEFLMILNWAEDELHATEAELEKSAK